MTHKNSVLARMEPLELGDACLIETTCEQSGKGNYPAVMRTAQNHRRYPESMKGREYSTSLYTLVSASDVRHAVRYCVRIERIL